MIRLAFDIGGTFTDFVLEDGARGRLVTHKRPTTPKAPAEAVVAGLRALLAEQGLTGSDLDTVLHATTVATNAIIERKGAPTALITTQGFRDVLIIGRQKRYETYDLYIRKPQPLIPRRAIFEAAERMAADGAVLEPLDTAQLDGEIDRIAEGGYRSIAVSLLHAYANPAHEQAIAARLAERMPEAAVSLSSEVAPKFREYERTSTVVANSYVKPVVAGYVEQLEGALSAEGFRHGLFIMQSSGGLVSPGLACAQPIRIVESGPAAGVLMSALVGRDEGIADLITFDMGGTTAKLGAVDNGSPAIMPSLEVDHVQYKRGSGLPINVPAVELLEIGAGGGSIAAVDMGTIRIGPESAGAEPGPICYGKGGTAPTVTDANLVLGYINPDNFNAGAMRLDRPAAEAGVVRAVAEPLGLDPLEAAWGIHLVASHNMEHAMRAVSVERGRDPRRYAMVAFGGAGPIHACRIARALGIPRVIVPQGAGVGSAVGLLRADARIDVSVTRVLRLDEADPAAVREVYAGLEARACADLAALGMPGEPAWARAADMRFAGQGFEIRVALPDGPIDAGWLAAAASAFRATYDRRNRYSDPDATIETVDWHLSASLPTPKGTAGRLDGGTDAAVTGSRPAYFPEAGGLVATRVLNRAAIRAAGSVTGPAVIEDADSTVVVPPGDTARISANGHLIVEIGAAAGGSD